MKTTYIRLVFNGDTKNMSWSIQDDRVATLACRYTDHTLVVNVGHNDGSVSDHMFPLTSIFKAEVVSAVDPVQQSIETTERHLTALTA